MDYRARARAAVSDEPSATETKSCHTRDKPRSATTRTLRPQYLITSTRCGGRRRRCGTAWRQSITAPLPHSLPSRALVARPRPGGCADRGAALAAAGASPFCFSPHACQGFASRSQWAAGSNKKCVRSCWRSSRSASRCRSASCDPISGTLSIRSGPPSASCAPERAATRSRGVRHAIIGPRVRSRRRVESALSRVLGRRGAPEGALNERGASSWRCAAERGAVRRRSKRAPPVGVGARRIKGHGSANVVSEQANSNLYVGCACVRTRASFAEPLSTYCSCDRGLACSRTHSEWWRALLYFAVQTRRRTKEGPTGKWRPAEAPDVL